jgi:hypothetical protein
MFQCFNTATASDPTLARGFERFEKLASAERDVPLWGTFSPFEH